MLEEAKNRTAEFQQRMKDENIQEVILTDESSIAYFAGFWGYLGVEFGRPTLLIIRAEAEPIIITPLMEQEMVSKMTWVNNVQPWEDFGKNSWMNVLKKNIMKTAVFHVELTQTPAIVRNFLVDTYPSATFKNITPLLSRQRMIKSPLEISVMKQAGKVAESMMKAAELSLKVGAFEYESALAVINAGTKTAAGFLTDKGWDAFISPMIHNLQVLQSGQDTSMVHRRASTKKYQTGDPVYFCFCNMAQFKQYKLGFDRMFFISEVSDELAKVQLTAINAQQAALAQIKDGVSAESVALAATEVYQQNGYTAGYRTGRSIGMAYLESPELKIGDKTTLKSGMTFAVDGGITVDKLGGGRIGDSVVVTQTGFEYLTNYSRDLIIV